MSVFNTVVKEENGKELKGYLATPKGKKKGPGIIIMHEVYGVTEGLKAIADHFAEAGFVAICPNMYWRENPDASFTYDPAPETMAAMPAKERIQSRQFQRSRTARRD